MMRKRQRETNSLSSLLLYSFKLILLIQFNVLSILSVPTR